MSFSSSTYSRLHGRSKCISYIYEACQPPVLSASLTLVRVGCVVLLHVPIAACVLAILLFISFTRCVLFHKEYTFEVTFCFLFCLKTFQWLWASSNHCSDFFLCENECFV